MTFETYSGTVLKRFEQFTKKHPDRNPCLFWSGQMSDIISNIKIGGIERLSKFFQQLEFCKDQYDKIIEERSKGKVRYEDAI